MRYTGGQWIYVRNKEQDNPKTGRLILQNCFNAKNIASIIPCFGMGQEEIEANARLIAAAPELLQALIEARQILCDFGMKPDSVGLIGINNVIEKATGSWTPISIDQK